MSSYICAGDAQGKSRKDERTHAGVIIAGTFYLRKVVIIMAFACGARFSETFYLKTEMDPDTGDCAVTVETVSDGVPVVATGTVTWDEGDGEG